MSGFTPQNADQQFQNVSAGQHVVARNKLSGQDAIFNTLYVASTSNLGPVGITGDLTVTGVVTAEEFTDGTSTLMDGLLNNANITMPIGTILTVTAGATGTAARAGLSTLVAGSILVPNSSVTANTLAFLTRSTNGGTGLLSYTKSAGVSFTINSSSSSDVSAVNWLLIEKA